MFTIVASSTTINWASPSTARIHQRLAVRRSVSAALGVAGRVAVWTTGSPGFQRMAPRPARRWQLPSSQTGGPTARGLFPTRHGNHEVLLSRRMPGRTRDHETRGSAALLHDRVLRSRT